MDIKVFYIHSGYFGVSSIICSALELSQVDEKLWTGRIIIPR